MTNRDLIHRVVSGIAFTVSVVMIVLENGARGAMSSFVLLLALACIWFPRELGEFTQGQLGGYRAIDQISPPGVVRFVGWISLVVLTVVLWKVMPLRSTW